MLELIPRNLIPRGREMLTTFPAVVVQGARQVGKSTFARMLVDDTPFHQFTLDDDSVRAAAMNDSAAFVQQFPDETLVIDEIQRAPELLLAIKASIDRDRQPGRFLLTGSSDLLGLSRTPDSLAGRAVTLDLHGLSQGELLGRSEDFASWLRRLPESPQGFTTQWSRESYVAALAQGGYPELIDLTPRMRSVWIDSYLERLLRRDVGDVSRGLSTDRLAAVLRLLAANQSGELVQARLADDLGMPKSSIASYIAALQTLYLTHDLPPWGANLTKREVGRHKVSVADSALAMRLNRADPRTLVSLTSASALGALLEAFAVGELAKQRGWSAEEFDLYHFRDRDGLEVDIVVEFADGRVFLLEVKASQTYRAEQVKGIQGLAVKLGDRFLGGAVLSLAKESVQLAQGIWGFPLAILWETEVFKPK